MSATGICNFLVAVDIEIFSRYDMYIHILIGMYFLELWYGSVALHGEGLPGAGLSVGEDCPVVTLGKLLYNKHTDRPTQRGETVRL